MKQYITLIYLLIILVHLQLHVILSIKVSNINDLYLQIVSFNNISEYNNNNHLNHRQLQNMKEQSINEKNYLLLHKCKDIFEAYSASYLIHIEHLLYQHIAYNLTWVNCEMGSFIMMRNNIDPNRDDINSTVLQTLDILDFSVIHLSAYERLQRRWHHSIKKYMNIGSIDNVINTISILQNRSLETQTIKKINNYMKDTLVIMPWLGYDMGAGHSKLGNRVHYLHACFWSFYRYYDHIIVYVKSNQDYNYIRNESGLPFYDVIHLYNLPKSASLPVATIQQTKERIINNTWNYTFQYIFFTESDQILLFRHNGIMKVIYEHLNKYHRQLLLPHRLMPYPNAVLQYHHHRNISLFHPFDWYDMNCCLPRQNCRDRKTWLKVSNETIPILNIYGLQVPLGNTNFHEETYRGCQLYPLGGLSFCP